MWQTNPVTIDGENSDWSTPYSFMDDKAKIEFSFSNDKENLYLTLKTSDRFTQMKILHSGMQVWLDVEGKKNKTTAIYYPLETGMPAMSAGAIRERPGKEEGHKENDRLKRQAENAKEYTLAGFKGFNGTYAIAQRNGCKIQIKMDASANGELIYELAIPFKSFYKDTIDTTDLGKAISICFEVNALKKPEMPSGGGRPEGKGMGGGNMGGGMPGGGMGGGGMAPPSGGPGMMGGFQDNAASFDATTTWSKIRLAYSE